MKKQTEASLQAEAYAYFNNNYCLKSHTPRCVWILIPNEVASVVGGIMKGLGIPQRIVTRVVSMVVDGMRRVGLCDGASDNIIVAPNAVYFVEFKLPHNNQQPNQKEFESRVTSLGHTYVVIKTLDQFKAFCERFIARPTKTTHEG